MSAAVRALSNNFGVRTINYKPKNIPGTIWQMSQAKNMEYYPSSFTDYTVLLALQEPNPATMPERSRFFWNEIAEKIDEILYSELVSYEKAPKKSQEREDTKKWMMSSVQINFQELMDYFRKNSPNSKERCAVADCSGRVIRYFVFYQFCLYYSDVVDICGCSDEEKEQIKADLLDIQRRYQLSTHIPRYRPHHKKKVS